MGGDWRRWFRVEWARYGGPEYAALALLPPAEARRVWRAAAARWADRPLTVVRILCLTLLLSLPGLGVLLVCQRLGVGLGVKLLAEALVHLALGLTLHRSVQQAMFELYRPFIRAQLLDDFDGYTLGPAGEVLAPTGGPARRPRRPAAAHP